MAPCGLCYEKYFFIMSLILSPVFLLLLWNEVGSSLFVHSTLKLHLKNRVCHVNYVDNRSHMEHKTGIKMIYFVTPTYPRPEQTPELTRLSHTLMHVPRIHWIVADDQPRCSNQLLTILRKSGLPFTYLSSPYPSLNRKRDLPRGVANRRAALNWLHENVHEGILYFGDDDNTVDLELFDEIRQTKKVSMFPVGLIGGFGVSTPVVRNGKIVAFFDSWPANRSFPVDMGGFAVNIAHLRLNATMPYQIGYEENGFLLSLGIELKDVEPLANNCSKVLVWHTQTTKNKCNKLKINVDKLHNWTDFVILLKELSNMGIINIDPNSGKKIFLSRDGQIYQSLSDIR